MNTRRSSDEENDSVEALLKEFVSGSKHVGVPDGVACTEPEMQHALDAVLAIDSHLETPGAGDQIGRYRLLHTLGTGGMGIVFAAKHEDSGKTFALKVLTNRRLKDPLAIARFEREIRLLSQFDHPNVISAIDGGCCNGVHFLAMTYIEGIDVGSIVQQLGPLDVGVSCEIVRQAAIGVQQLHDRGLLHRDIKPSNLMVGYNSVVCVTDFGLARVVGTDLDDELTHSGQVMGTIAYMPPEQFDGLELTYAADLYSLGATLWYLLSGNPPSRWSAESHQLLNPKRALPDSVPENLRTLLFALLQPDPHQRLQRADALADQLQPLADLSQLSIVIERLRLLEPKTKSLQTDKINHGIATRALIDDPSTRLSTRGRRRWVAWVIIALVSTVLSSFAILYSGRDVSVRNEVVTVPDDDAEPADLPANDLSKMLSLKNIDAETAAVERAAAQWVLEHGGNVLLFPTVHALDVDDLPQTRFAILNISLVHADIPPDQMHRLKGLCTVRLLELSGNPITSDSMASLADYPSIRWLYIGKTDVDDSCVNHLLPLGRTLETLDMHDCAVTSRCVQQLEGFELLRELLISGTQIDNDALQGLERFSSLVRLDISNTAVTAEGIQHLRDCPKLKFLRLNDTGIDDAAIDALSQLSSLRELEVRQTQFSPEGRERLISALPKCDIRF